MKVQSSVMPDPVWVKIREQGKATVRLRKNAEEKTREDEEGTSTCYEYDEVEITIPNRADVGQYVADNFDDLWMASFKGAGELKGWQELQDEELEAIVDMLEED